MIDVQALAAACPSGTVVPAGPADRAGGVPARVVAAPGTGAELAALLTHCAGTGLSAVPRGAGTKLDWAAPPTRVDVLVDTRSLSGVYKHAAGDLVATVGAGTPVREVQAHLARSGQRLSLGSGFADATVGGVVVSGESGPLRLRYGAPRDLLIGAEFVRADGVVAHSGGQVVKNVAGYDVGRLLCGSYGSLAVLASATFRLHPLPAARAYVSCPFESYRQLDEIVAATLDSPYAPVAVEVDLTVEPPASTAAGPAGTVAVLLEGSAPGVAARAGGLAGLLGAATSSRDTPPPWWGRYPFQDGDVVVKLILPVANLSDGLVALRDGVPGPVAVRGSAGTGVLHAALPGDTPADRIGDLLDQVRRAFTGTAPGSGTPGAREGWCVLLRAPAGVWAEVDGWGPVPGVELMRRVKQRFDPGRLLAPGRFVGGL